MTNGLLITRAIQALCPDAEFSIIDNDLEKINWIAGTNLPTATQIKEQMKTIEIADKKAEAEAAAKKAAAEAKLAALGLTPDDLKALGLA